MASAGPHQLRVDGAHLIAESPSGTALVGGLSIVADAAGLSVVGPEPSARRTIPWAQIGGISFRLPATLPDGRPATALDIAVGARTLRLLFAVDTVSPVQALALERELASLAAAGRYPAQAPPAPSSGPTAQDSGPGAMSGAPGGFAGPAAQGVGPPRPTGPVGPASQTAGPPPSGGAPPGAGGFAPAPPTLGAPTTAAPAPAGAGVPPLAPWAPGTLGAQTAGSSSGSAGAPPWVPGASGGAPWGAGEWPTAGQATGVGPRRQRRVSRPLLVALAVAVLAGAGYGAWWKFGRSQGGSPPASSSSNAADRALAQAVLVQATDLPGWSTKPGAAGPFGPSGQSSPAIVRQEEAAVPSLAVCLGLRLAQVRHALDLTNAPPAQSTAMATSPTYADPLTGNVVASESMVFDNPQVVAQDEQVFGQPARSATCLVSFFTALFGAIAPPGLQAAVAVRPMGLPTAHGVVAEGFAITVAAGAGSQANVANFDLVELFAGRVEVMLEFQSAGTTPFPSSLASTLVAAVEARVASAIGAGGASGIGTTASTSPPPGGTARI